MFLYLFKSLKLRENLTVSAFSHFTCALDTALYLFEVAKDKLEIDRLRISGRTD